MRQLSRDRTNVGQTERKASVVLGSALVLYALIRRTWAGIVPALAGAVLLYRGVTGRSRVLEALGIRSNDGARQRGINVNVAVTVNRPREDVYRFWRTLENLPRFMRHLESVEVRDDRRSHWVADVPAGIPVAWDAEITDDRPNELIRWETVSNAPVKHHGSVRFSSAPNDRGTVVMVTFTYEPPAGGVGDAFGHLLNVVTEQQIENDVRRFKQIMEAGEVATVQGQPAGERRRRDQMVLSWAGKE